MTQVQDRVRPDVSERLVADRLEELQALEVVATEAPTPDCRLYYVPCRRSNRSDSGHGFDGDAAAVSNDNPLDQLSIRGFLTLHDSAGIRTLVLAGYQLSLILFALGIPAAALGLDEVISSDLPLWTAALHLLVVCLCLQLAERVTRSRRRSTASQR